MTTTLDTRQPVGTLLPTTLQAVLAVADCGSFSAAALHLGLRQSTISHAVGVAERTLGVQLFQRGRFGAQLTPAGRTVLEHARHAALSLEAMMLAASGELCGTLRLVACRSFLRHFVTPALHDFKQRFPLVEVALQDTTGEHDEIENAVRRGEAHLGIGRLPMHPELVSVPLLEDEYLIISSARTPHMNDWNDVHASPYIVCTEDCAPHVAEHIARHSRPVQVKTRLKDPTVALGLVAEGLGHTIFTRLVVAPQPAGLRTQSLPTPLWRTLGAVTTSAGARHPLVRAFMDTALTPAALRARAGALAPLLRFHGTQAGTAASWPA